MIIRLSKVLGSLVFLIACEPKLVDDPIPVVAFSDVVINLSFPEFTELNRDGGFKALNDQGAGVRGIILYRNTATSYVAYERNCSYRPNEACATVDIHNSGLFMIDPCCSSTFNFADGMPNGGPAWRPLLQYRTQLNGNLLTITDEIIN